MTQYGPMSTEESISAVGATIAVRCIVILKPSRYRRTEHGRTAGPLPLHADRTGDI
jgi:hypothetical protein